MSPPLKQGCSRVNSLQISSYSKPQKLRDFGDVTKDFGLGWIPNPMRVSLCETEQGTYRHRGNHGKIAAETAPCYQKPLKARSCQELEEAGRRTFGGVALVTP